MLSSRERRSCSSATQSINKSKACYYQRHGSPTEQITKFSGTDTFGELSEKYFNIFSALLFSNNCLQVHMVFDHY